MSKSNKSKLYFQKAAWIVQKTYPFITWMDCVETFDSLPDDTKAGLKAKHLAEVVIDAVDDM